MQKFDMLGRPILATEGYLTSQPAGVTRFGGAPLPPSDYQPVGFEYFDRPSNSTLTGRALDFRFTYGRVREPMVRHLEGPNPLFPRK